MKTQNKNLAFNKSAVVDLNDDQLQSVNGGTTTLCTGTIIATIVIMTQK
ncbi:class I lanthipeptide [Lacinutrix sp. Hel_I_90]|nr:class I lanthipeptide [Lacinutrix sp. Hel_I_90]